MKVTYKFNDGTSVTVETNENIGNVIVEIEKAEHANDEKERYHRAYSKDKYDYEGSDISSLQDEPSRIIENNEYNQHIYSCLLRLSEIQRRRLIMFSEGMTIAEIARFEGVAFNVVKESIEAARKKFLKNF